MGIFLLSCLLTSYRIYCFAGYEAPNLRKLADKVAAAGFYVAKAFEDTKLVISAIQSKGISAIGAAGFCHGAKVVVELAKDGLIQAGVLLHPSFVTVDDIKEVKAPMAILGAEIDKLSSPELVKQFMKIFSSKPEVPSFVKSFPVLLMRGL
ncbi:alpha/beta-hydrolase superfamily protein [Forsythia ovata]|uniref:Alpha/beta-hydrolase superfamily protein n=1 Tax=Forsythia ovata TaxID=205694 RepID=A0ABD1VDE7_9LAMI